MGGLFSSKSKSTSTTKGTNTTTPKVPAEYQAALDKLLSEASSVYNTPFQAYTGPAVAGLSTDERAAYAGVRAMQGQNDPLYDALRGMLLGNVQDMSEYTGLPTESELAALINPYQQNVTDIALREIQEGSDTALNKLQRMTSLSGGFGGTRGALLESELGRNTLQQLADTQYTGSRDAYESAYDKFFKSRELQRLGRSATVADAMNFAGVSTSNKLKELAALEGAGRTARGIAQGALDFQVNEFFRKEAYPRDMLNYYANLVYGYPTNLFPVEENINQTTNTTTKQSANPLSSLLGLAGMAAGIPGVGAAMGLAGGAGAAASGIGGGLSGAAGSAIGSSLFGSSQLASLASNAPTIISGPQGVLNTGTWNPYNFQGQAGNQGFKQGGLIRGYAKGGIVNKYKKLIKEAKKGKAGEADPMAVEKRVNPQSDYQANLLMQLVNPSELSKEGLDPKKNLTGYKFGGSVIKAIAKEAYGRLKAKREAMATPQPTQQDPVVRNQEVATTPADPLNFLNYISNNWDTNTGGVSSGWDKPYNPSMYPASWAPYYYKKGGLVKAYQSGGDVDWMKTPLWKILSMLEPTHKWPGLQFQKPDDYTIDNPSVATPVSNQDAIKMLMEAVPPNDTSSLEFADLIKLAQQGQAAKPTRGTTTGDERAAGRTTVTPKGTGSNLMGMISDAIKTEIPKTSINGVGTPIKTTGTAASPKDPTVNDFFSRWMDNPLTKMGLNIMAASEPGVPGITAIGRGLKTTQQEYEADKDEAYTRAQEQHDKILDEAYKRAQIYNLSPEGFRFKAELERENDLAKLAAEGEMRARLAQIPKAGSTETMPVQLKLLLELAKQGDPDALNMIKNLSGMPGGQGALSEFYYDDGETEVQ